MRQVFLEKGILAVKEVCQPELDDYSILVSVSYSYMTTGLGLSKAIESQKYNFFNNLPSKVSKLFQLLKVQGINYTKAAIKDKINGMVVSLGHSCSGIVIGVGKKVKNFRAGDHVACIGAGFAHHADVVCIPEKLAININENLIKESSIVGIGSIAVQAVRRASIELGESVLVLGADPLGQLIASLAKRSGGTVAHLELDSHRKSVVEDKSIFSSIKEAFSIFNNQVIIHGVDCIIVTPNALQETDLGYLISFLRIGGKIVITGDSSFKVPENICYQKEINIIFALSYGPGKFDPIYEVQGHDYPYSHVRWTENRNMQFFIDLVEKKEIDLTGLFKYEYELNDINFVFQRLKNEEILSTVIKYDHKLNNINLPIKALIPSLILGPKEKFTVSLYGMSNPIRFFILPIFETISQLEFKEIIDHDGALALSVVKSFKNVKAISGGIQQCIESSSDVIIVSPSAKITINDVISLAQHGKVVALSRPISRNFEELELLTNFLNNNPHVLIAVGYGRSFSPYIAKIKKTIEKRRTPLIIYYRLNTIALTPSQRLDPEWSVGKIIAQASHVIDLFCTLVESVPLSISVESIKPINTNSFPSDNFIANISFVDGSIVSLLLTSNGSIDSGTERMEIIFDNGTIICEDFLELRSYGLAQQLNYSSRINDYGYQELFTNFFEGLNKVPAQLPINYSKMLLVEKITLIIDELVCSNGGEQKL
jgi:threonine dehydrogenase-like Zn-dependent dehydrogenase/predicted dehydrogenase